MPTKTKKELRAEEKEREKAAKAAKKAEEKAFDEKRQEASRQRQEAWKQQREMMNAAMEESKRTAEAEARARGEDPPKEVEKEKTGGLMRNRLTSMSLRKKPTGMFGKDKDKDKAKDEKLPPVPQNGSAGVPNGAPTEGAVQAAQAAAEKTTNAGASPAVQAVQQEETKKHRFSLGRKKSTMIG